MSQLSAVYQLLAAGLREDSVLCLAHAAVWLDPFRAGWPGDEFEDDSLEAALEVLRSAFPDIYALVVNAAHHGAGYDELERLICTEVSAQGIPLDSLESMSYGIPLPAYGVVLHDPDFYTDYANLIPVVALFGIEAGEDYPVEIPSHTYAITQQLMTSLIEHPDERYQQVGWLMGFVGSSTGNSSCDLDWESLAEFEPLSWEPDDLAFARAIIEEADEIMEAVQAGLDLFYSHPRIRPALEHNVQRLCRFFRQPEKERNPNECPRLRWPALDRGLARATESDP